MPIAETVAPVRPNGRCGISPGVSRSRVRVETCGERAVRVAWRLAFGHPPPVPMPAWQARAAAYSHALLYILLLVIPLSGWLYSSATGVQVLYLGQISLPDLVPKDKALADTLRRVHVALNASMAAIVVIHVAAALRHHWVERDESLRRMLPFLRPNDAAPR